MSLTTCYVGALARIAVTDITVEGAATDPTTLTLKVMSPAGTISTYTYALGEITKDATGSYHKDVSMDQEGVWKAQYKGTGAAQFSKLQEWRVLDSPFD